MPENVQQTTIQSLIEQFITPGTQVYTDEYDIDRHLPEWGFDHRTVCHSRGEYARDEEDDGFHEVHVNTAEGCWSLLRSWLRPHRGISQEKQPLYPGLVPVRAQRPPPRQRLAQTPVGTSGGLTWRAVARRSSNAGWQACVSSAPAAATVAMDASAGR